MTKQTLFSLCGFEEATASLAALYCGKADPQGLRAFLEKADFDALPSDLTCMAANAAAAELDRMPQALTPRLRGLIKYIHALNSGMTAGLLSLAAALQKEGICLLLLEDTALALSAAEGGRRQLWLLRVGIKRRDYERAAAIARQNGWTAEVTPWSTVLKRNATQQVALLPLAENSYLWQNTTALQKGSLSLLCPEPAALLTGLCQMGFRALTKESCRAAMVHWLMDMKLLLSLLDDAQWQRALALARQEKALFHMGLLLHIYAAVSDGAVPAGRFCSEEEALRTAKLLRTFRACPEKGKKIKRVYLLCRLRRPDSRAGALGCFAREAFKKLYASGSSPTSSM